MRIGNWFCSAICSVLLASPAMAQTWSVVSLDAIGCAASTTLFSTTVSGAGGAGPEHWRTIVRTGSGEVYMNEDAGEVEDGNYNWSLYNSSSGGPVTNVFPLPPAIPIIVDFQFINGALGPVVFHREVTLSRCDGGTIVQDRVIVAPRPAASAVPVPAIGPYALGLLAFLVGLVPVLRRRARG